MATWTSVAESFNGIISRLRIMLNDRNSDPDEWLEKLKSAFEEAKELKKQFTHKQRLLLLKQPAEFDEGKPENDTDDQTEIIETHRSTTTKRRGTGESAESVTKKKRDSGQDRASPTQSQPIIDPEVRPLFDAIQESYTTLESLALDIRKAVSHDQTLCKRFDEFIWQLVFSSFIVIRHVPALLNVERKSQPHTIICALIGHESQKLKDGMSVCAGLITESQGRELRTTVPKLEYPVQYALSKSVPRKRTDWVQAVPLKWLEKDLTGSNLNPTGLYMASFYEITVHKKGKTQETSPDGQQSGRKRATTNADGDSSESKWVGGYHLYFYTMVRNKEGAPEKKFLTLSLPFEILKNYSGQKDRKWRDAMWRLGFCINDGNCAAKKLDANTPTIDEFMEVLAYFFRGFVNTSLGLTWIHKICLKRYLKKFLKPKSENVDYVTFRDKFWSYFFKAVDYIKQNRFLWEKHLFNYCFLDRMETEAVLFHKKGYTFLIRFQESDKAHGFPSISMTLPDKTGPPFFAHSKLQEKINIRNYTLIHCIKYAQVEMCTGNESKGKPVSHKLVDFEVFGKGKCNFGQLEPEDQNNYDSRNVNVKDNEPFFEYTDERRVLFPIRVRQGDQVVLSKHLQQFSQTELGKFLSFHGGSTFELMHEQIQQAENGRAAGNSVSSNPNAELNEIQLFLESIDQEPPNPQHGYYPQNHQNDWVRAEQAYCPPPFTYDTQSQVSSTSRSSESNHGYPELNPDTAYSQAFNCSPPMASGGNSEYDEYGQDAMAAMWSTQTGTNQNYATHRQHSSSDIVVTDATFSPVHEYTQLQPYSQDSSRQTTVTSPNMPFFGNTPPYASLMDNSSSMTSPHIYENSNSNPYEMRLEPMPNNTYQHSPQNQRMVPQHQVNTTAPMEQPCQQQMAPITNMTEIRQNLIDWIMTTPTDQIMERMKLLGVDPAKQ